MQRLLLEAALLVRLHSWPPSISVWFPSALTLLAARSCTLIHTWFIHSLHSLLIGLLSSLFHYLCMHLSLSLFLLSSCLLSSLHSSSAILVVLHPRRLLRSSGRMSPCAQSAEVLHWAPHLSCCYWCYVQGQCPHTAPRSFITELLTPVSFTVPWTSQCAWQRTNQALLWHANPALFNF